MGLKFGDVSPLAGMVTGEGMTGDLIRQGVGGLLPQMIAKDAYDSKQQSIAGEKAKEAENLAQTEAMLANQKKKAAMKDYVSTAREVGGIEGYKGYKKGGKVSSASKRADGIAIRGKTRA